MAALKQTFLEESFEGLQIMESGILEINIETPDKEEINTIFRAIHSIKGGAGTFGFSEIVGLTHVFENILDEIRNQKLILTVEINDTFLQSIDALEGILVSYQNDEEPDSQIISVVTNELQMITSSESSIDDQEGIQKQSVDNVSIIFKPDQDILNTGNEPIRIIRDLHSVADISIDIDEESIPTIEDDLLKIQLKWNIAISGKDIDLEEIKEPFEWIEDECEILTFDFVEKTSNSSTDIEYENNKKNASKKESKVAISTTMRVDTARIDELVNLVGELVITQSMLSQKDDNGQIITKDIEDALATLDRQMRELQDGIISVRMVPINSAFSRIPRIVRDTSKNLNKEIILNISGENTEVDKTVSEKITDPLVHIIRNAVDHGIESSQERIDAGKQPNGTINVSAYHQGGNLMIDISDDGGGVNTEKVYEKALQTGVIQKSDNLSTKEINELIFAPGFSTADVVSDVSGRGVGMDVVKKNIISLKGEIELFSEEGKGSLFRIKLPLTLAILEGQLARVGDQVFVFPILSILESIQLKEDHVKYVQGIPSIYKLRDEFIPIINLFERFKIEDNSTNKNKRLLVIVEHNKKKIALRISELLNQQQVVIKNLDKNYKKTDGFSGATILGDGKVSLILDIASIAQEEHGNDL